MGQSHAKNSEKQILACINEPNNIDKITSLFASFDVRKDGALDKEEFRSFGKQLSHIMHHDHGAHHFSQEYVDSSIDQLFEVYLLLSL